MTSLVLIVVVSFGVVSLAACNVAPTSTTTVAPTRTAAQVLKVIDGDTIEVSIAGKVYPVRYLGIDAPEADAPWGPEATAMNKQLVGKTVYLEKDVSEADQYGRLLRYVFVGNPQPMFFNSTLVELGYARVAIYPPDVRYRALLEKSQRDARSRGVGIWRAATPQETKTQLVNIVLNILPWVGVIVLLALVVLVDWSKVLVSLLRLMLAILVVLSGIGYFISSRLADVLPRWFPGQGILSTVSFWLGILALAGLIVAVDWKKTWRKYKWQMIVGIELTLLVFIYTSGLFALVPGASQIDTEIQQFIHLKPWTIEVASAQSAKEVAAFSILKAQPKGEFLVVQTRTTNSSAEPAHVWGTFELYDIRGRRFDAHVSSWFSAIDSLNPGLWIEPTLAFDVPSARGLWLLTMYPSPLHRMGGVTVAFLVP